MSWFLFRKKTPAVVVAVEEPVTWAPIPTLPLQPVVEVIAPVVAVAEDSSEVAPVEAVVEIAAPVVPDCRYSSVTPGTLRVDY